jgi:hypothetical protein
MPIETSADRTQPVFLQLQEDTVSQCALLVVNLEPLSTSILPVRTRSGGLAAFSESLRQV